MLDFASTEAQGDLFAHADLARARDGLARREADRGRCNYHAGQAAEAAVERHCLSRGWTILERRWRCPRGEIDLICRDGADYVVLEVKAGPTHDAAMARITPRQVARIHAAAEVFLGRTPEGAFASVRLDAALVDATGRVEMIENALLPC